MDLKEFGKILKEERLRQGLEISEVMEKTKISRMNLEAIEEGNERGLPHPVYAKGFVKNYAKFLGLDADKMGNTLAGIYVSPEQAEANDLIFADTQNKSAAPRTMPRRIMYLAIVLLLVCVGVGVLFFLGTLDNVFTSRDVSPVDEQAVTESAAVETRRDQPGDFQPVSPEVFVDLSTGVESELADGETFPELESTTPPGEPAVAIPVQRPLETETAPLSDPEQVAESSSEPALPETPVTPAPSPVRDEPPGVVEGEQTLEIRAFENCWLSAQADRARPREVFLRPDERFVITFEQSLELKLGNAGGVNLFLNGRPWPLRAESGEVMVLRLP